MEGTCSVMSILAAVSDGSPVGKTFPVEFVVAGVTFEDRFDPLFDNQYEMSMKTVYRSCGSIPHPFRNWRLDIASPGVR